MYSELGLKRTKTKNTDLEARVSLFPYLQNGAMELALTFAIISPGGWLRSPLWQCHGGTIWSIWSTVDSFAGAKWGKTDRRGFVCLGDGWTLWWAQSHHLYARFLGAWPQPRECPPSGPQPSSVHAVRDGVLAHRKFCRLEGTLRFPGRLAVSGYTGESKNVLAGATLPLEWGQVSFEK